MLDVHSNDLAPSQKEMGPLGLHKFGVSALLDLHDTTSLSQLNIDGSISGHSPSLGSCGWASFFKLCTSALPGMAASRTLPDVCQ